MFFDFFFELTRGKFEQTSRLVGWSRQRRSRDSLEPFIWRFGGSSLKVVTELDLKVHYPLEGVEEENNAHGDPTVSQAQPWALYLHNFLNSSKQPWEERKSHLRFIEEQ